MEMMEVCIFLLFKQKTAYEMRIRYWSSDVCSSDLLYPGDANLELRIMISDGLLFTISYGIGDPTVDGRLPPASAVDANLDLARERAFRNFAVEVRTRQTGTCAHGFVTDDTFEIGQARDSRVWLRQAGLAGSFRTTPP